MGCPGPGDTIASRIVVASVYYRDLSETDRRFIPWDDDWPDVVYTIILLNKQSPYFSVAHICDNDEGDGWLILTEESHFNIVLAVEDYVQKGGDI